MTKIKKIKKKQTNKQKNESYIEIYSVKIIKIIKAHYKMTKNNFFKISN